MKASQAGVTGSFAADRVLSHFESVYNYPAYIQAKYDGLIPENYPSRNQMREINSKINYHKTRREFDDMRATIKERTRMMKPVHTFNKEWLRQQ